MNSYRRSDNDSRRCTTMNQAIRTLLESIGVLLSPFAPRKMRKMPLSPRESRLPFSSRYLASLLITLGVVLGDGFPVWAQSESSPIDGAQSSAVWFDTETGKAVPVKLPPSDITASNRDSRWLPQAKRVKAPPKNATTPGGGAGTGWSNFSAGNFAAWFLLCILLAAAIGTLWYGLSKADLGGDSSARNRSNIGSGESPDEITVERMKHLPQELRRTDVNMREETQRLMQEGSFDQAIILLYGHQLLLLDREGFLRLNRGKTNRRYIRECRSNDASIQYRSSGEFSVDSQLTQTIDAFERSYFGKHSIEESEFEMLWQNNLELEKAMHQRDEVTV